MKKIIQGYIHKNFDCDIEIKDTNDTFGDALAEILKYFAYEVKNSRVDNHEDGLGGFQTIIPNCQLSIHYSKEPISIDDLDIRLMTIEEGLIDCIGDYTGYSEYTITGLVTRTLTIGGHDLSKEIYSHVGEYITMIIETKDD